VKFTLSWLKEHLDTQAGLDEIVSRLTMNGLEVESVTERDRGFEGFVVARVLAADPHPDADRLQVCKVDTGSGEVQVVCGAPNARAGMKGVFAPSGSLIPGSGIKLKKAKIRGVESNGMLLSEREMGLSEEHEGIVELDDDAKVGAPVAAAMGLDDPLIEIAITPNRGDCLGVRGIARDLAASGLGVLKAINTDPVPPLCESPIKVHLDLDEDHADACPHFVGRYIRGVNNGESPKWLKDKLLAVGLRPISALVDITNLMTLDLNRPLHVFDADKIKGDIHVRMARADEKMLALDGKEYVLDEEMTAIADDQDAEALGGVMGGERTGCTPETVNVFMESAIFDPVRTAATGRKINLMSDARYRFERGIDPAFLADGMEVATRLVLDICGGEPSELVVAGAEASWQRSISFRPDRVRTLGGVEVERSEIDGILGKLGFGVNGSGDTHEVSVPSWRGDIVGEACLVEEVVRIKGYDNIPAVSLPRTDSLPHPALTPEQSRRARARRVLAGRGLIEAVTLSFMAGKDADLFGGVPDSLRLVNPISSDLDVMRPSILPNLIAAAGRNADKGYGDAALFEVGPQFSGDRTEDEAMLATGIRAGRSGPRNWARQPRPVDIFDAKADVLGLLEALGAPVAKAQVINEAPAWYHPGRSGALTLGPQTVLAHFGEIHPGVLARMNVKGPIVGFEVYLDTLPRAKAKKSAARPLLQLSPYQPVARDFAFILDEDVAAAVVVNAALGADKSLISGVGVFDLFSGGNLGEGKKSLAITVTLQPRDKTLTDAEIDDVAGKIVQAVEKATGGALRS